MYYIAIFGSFSGVITLAMTNPIWVAKTRLCLQYDRHPAGTVVGRSSVVHYKGMLDCLLKIYKLEGIRGLYKVSMALKPDYNLPYNVSLALKKDYNLSFKFSIALKLDYNLPYKVSLALKPDYNLPYNDNTAVKPDYNLQCKALKPDYNLVFKVSIALNQIIICPTRLL